MSQSALEKLLKPRSIAVIGASSNPSKISGKPIDFLLKQNFSGEIFPVNPGADRILGLPCYPSIAALPHTPDVALVLLGSEATIPAVKELAEMGTPAAIVLASGFGETGPLGQSRQRRLKEAARSMRLLGPNTIGLVNLTDTIALSPSSALSASTIAAGCVGLISQSGGIMGSLLSRANARGLGLSKLISTSNEVDLEAADFIDWLVDDPHTQVIVLYLETIRSVERFRHAAGRANRAGKPLVAFKMGRSASGAQAVASHTGAMAGSDQVYDALFEQLGVIRARTFAELIDIPLALANRRPLNGRRIAILTSTGGGGALIADHLGLLGFECPHPDEATAARLRQLQTGDEAVMDRNPIDVTLAGLKPAVLAGAVRALLQSDRYDALVVIIGSSGIEQPDLMAEAIRHSYELNDKPVLAYVSPDAPRAAHLLAQQMVPTFLQPESVGIALEALWRERHRPTADDGPHEAIPMPIQEIDALLGRNSLDEYQAKLLFRKFSIPCVAETVVDTEDQALAAARALGGSVALKWLDASITHKSDVGGVAVNVSPKDIVHQMRLMHARVHDRHPDSHARFLVQAMVTQGVELILGMKTDPLGQVLLLGSGGIYAEILKDTAIHLHAPNRIITPQEALALIQKLKSWPILKGVRGQPPADIDALVTTIVNFSKMVQALGPRLASAEINPLFVLAQGHGTLAADAVVVLSTGQDAESEVTTNPVTADSQRSEGLHAGY